MLFHDDEKGYAVIGEAVVNLALGEKDITIDSLIAELRLMQQAESHKKRSQEITEAINWLKSFRTVGSRGQTGLYWFNATALDDDERYKEEIVRLRSDDEDGR